MAFSTDASNSDVSVTEQTSAMSGTVFAGKSPLVVVSGQLGCWFVLTMCVNVWTFATSENALSCSWTIWPRLSCTAATSVCGTANSPPFVRTCWYV